MKARQRLVMGPQMYFYYLEWLFVHNQNNVVYLQITTLLNNQNAKLVIYYITKMQAKWKIGYL